MSNDSNKKPTEEKSKRVPVFDHALPPVKASTPMPKVKPPKSEK